MELHHGFRPDYEPTLASMDDQEALIIGAQSLTRQRRTERQIALNTDAKVIELFTKYPNGIIERDLINELAESLDIGQDEAASAVDNLVSRGFAIFDRKKGLITSGSLHS